MRILLRLLSFVVLAATVGSSARSVAAVSLEGTDSLVMPKDVVGEQMQQAVGYFGRRVVAAETLRDATWKPDFASTATYEKSLETHRLRCRTMLGLQDNVSSSDQAIIETIADTKDCLIQWVTIPLANDTGARGLLMTPKKSGRHAAILVCPDADTWPSRFAGIESQNAPPAWLRNMLARGAAVCIPQSVERLQDHACCKTTQGKDRRLILHRLGYVVGQSMTGFDVQEALAAVNYLSGRPDIDATRIGIAGIGQGGMTALYAAAVDRRILAAVVVNCFQRRGQHCDEPADRRLPGQLLEFGDAELAALIAPRLLAVAWSPASPGSTQHIEFETRRAMRFYEQLGQAGRFQVISGLKPEDTAAQTAELIAALLGLPVVPSPMPSTPEATTLSKDQALRRRDRHFEERLAMLRKKIDASESLRQQRWQITQRPSGEFPQVRPAMLEDYRRLVGEVSDAHVPMNPRTQLALITDKYKAYRVMLDVVEGVAVYGNLLIPRHIEGRLPAVICQHGLNGLPEMITGLDQKEDTPYHEFGRHLAERGYVVFAPLLMHHYPVEQINEQVRLADAVGMMRIALPIAQTQRVLDFLASLPCVNSDRIGYYGLSYGGYSAIWMAPLLDRLAAVVVSGHFNDWRSKITSDTEGTSYLMHPDEDFYNWDILHRFTHPEMIAMIAPRPVCIEYGSRDGITTPAWTDYAWRQVTAIRDRLGWADRVTLTRYDGVHEVHGIETFDFLDRHLAPERPVGRDYEYTLRAPFDKIHTNALTQILDVPYVTHTLDSRPETFVRGLCRLPRGAKEFRGMAIRLSAVGRPGPISIRFGTSSGADDLGTATIDPNTLLPLFEQWYPATLPATNVRPDTPMHFEVRGAGGTAPSDCVIVYGPQPLGGNDYAESFGLCYRVLTERPEDAIRPPGKEYAYEYLRRMLGPYGGDVPSRRLSRSPTATDRITRIGNDWTIRMVSDPDGVLETAARDLQVFLIERCGLADIELNAGPGAVRGVIELKVVTDPRLLENIKTNEGYCIDAKADRISILGRTPRGVMRGVYQVEEMIQFRGGPHLAADASLRECRFDRRVICSVVPGGTKYTEVSQPLLYTDGLLQRISHQGFNGLWVWVNTEEVTLDSKVFPEFNDPQAPLRFARLNDLCQRAKRFGIDVYIYYSQYCHHWVPESFYKKHPDARGTDWGNALCTSNAMVRDYLGETARTLVRNVPGIRGMIVIYNGEGLYYCGSTEDRRAHCPRCRKRTCEDIAAEYIKVLYDALKTGGADKELVIWPYGGHGPEAWTSKVIRMVPRDVIFQADFSKGAVIEKDGIRHATGDYNIATIGPPPHFVDQYNAAKNAGLRMMVKTEHAISQEFITVPYIPCMRQWYRRVSAMSECTLDGLLGNWCHYGYTPSRPAELLMWYSWDASPAIDDLLIRMAQRDFGNKAAPHVVSAWEHFSVGIQHYPYSDPVARIPGPIQKGPTQPLLLDPDKKMGLPWRSWHNDLKWTAPWGPQITAKHFRLLEGEYSAGIADLEKARGLIDEPGSRADIDKEIGIARMIRASVHTILNFIDWVPLRDAYAKAPPGAERERLRQQLIRIARDELANVQAALPVAEADSRLGASSEGGGMMRGGLFTPALIRHKIGLTEDLIERQLAP